MGTKSVIEKVEYSTARAVCIGPNAREQRTLISNGLHPKSSQSFAHRTRFRKTDIISIDEILLREINVTIICI